MTIPGFTAEESAGPTVQTYWSSVSPDGGTQQLSPQFLDGEEMDGMDPMDDDAGEDDMVDDDG